MFALFKRAATKKEAWAYTAEIKALALLAVSLFLAAALLSHNAADHSWFYYDTAYIPTTNWCGYIGACLSGILFYLFGSASLLLVCWSLFMFHFLIHKKTVAQEWDRMVAYGILLSTIATLFALYEIDFLGSSVAGGYCGRLISSVLHHWFDNLGTLILLYTLLVASLIIIFRFSFVRIVQYLFKNLSINSARVYIIDPLCVAVLYIYSPIQKLMCAVQSWIKQKFFSVAPLLIDEENSPFDREFWKEITNAQKKSARSAASEKEAPIVCPVSEPQKDDPKFYTSSIISSEPILPNYQLPHLDMFIGVDEEQNDHALMQELEKRAAVLQEKLERFDVFGKVTAIKRGPVVTLFEYQPQIDTKISKIVALEDDLALALQATSIRIIAPIPGRSVVGFEVANKNRRSVMLSTLIKTDAYNESKASLPMILGVDTIGNTVVIDLVKMPHLLMAGSTGSGKSVALNAMLISLLCKTSPDDLRLILIDPKRLEFAPYADIAHLLFPIVTDPKLAPSVLRWVVKQMEQRYEIMAQAGARNIHDYRAKAQTTNTDPMPFIVVIIDELADLMMTAGKEVEDAIIRITQMARAAGIHLISATQRPSVDVITGIIKVNFPSRISFRVTSKIDSRTILDCSGADKLLGRGDMLFLDASDSLLKRVHGAYVLDKEINQVIAHIRAQRASDYLDLKQVCQEDRVAVDAEQDAMYEEICGFLQEIDEVSISLLQRRFRIGYNRSARIIDMLESQGLIAPSYGGKTRKVIR